MNAKKTLMAAGLLAAMAARALPADGAKTIPILGWHGIQPDQVSAARYDEARDMGMTILMQWAPRFPSPPRGSPPLAPLTIAPRRSPGLTPPTRPPSSAPFASTIWISYAP